MTTKKLGKRPVKLDPRTLRLGNYFFKKELPSVPDEVSWVVKVPSWPMYLNDELGDCVVAASGHMIEQWSFYANPPGVLPHDQQILQAYEDISGYVPGDPSTDNGATMLDALNYWRKTGIADHKIWAYAKVNIRNRDEVRASIQLFGNLYVGLQMPISAQGQDAWTVADGGIYGSDGQRGGWGGHCVPIVAASPQTVTCITWGEVLKMSWNFLEDYADEAYAVLSLDWVQRSGTTPSMLNLDQLSLDLASIT